MSSKLKEIDEKKDQLLRRVKSFEKKKEKLKAKNYETLSKICKNFLNISLDYNNTENFIKDVEEFKNKLKEFFENNE